MSSGKWKRISVGDAEYLIRAGQRDGIWKVSLTNLVEIWTEDLDGEKILHKCEKLNPNLCVEDANVHELAGRMLEDIPKHVVKASTERIELTSELEGGIFEFALDLTRDGPLRLWNEVTMPLCLAAGQLDARRAVLLDLVKRKDAEISEYRLNGAELIRKHIRTEPFDENSFEKKQIPIQNVDNCQDVFRTIMEFQGVEIKIFPNDKDAEKISSGEAFDNPEASVKIEAEDHLGENNFHSVADSDTSNVKNNLRSDTSIETTIEPSITVVPKEEKTSSEKTSPSPKSLKSSIKTDEDEKKNTPKRTQNVSTSPIKRAKKDIHDFIK